MRGFILVLKRVKVVIFIVNLKVKVVYYVIEY